MPDLRPRRLGQYNRVVTAGRHAGLRPLHPKVVMDPDQGTPVAVPLVAPRRIEHLPTGPPIEIRRPEGIRATGVRRSHALLKRTVLLPCHAGMEAISQGEVTEVLSAVSRR